MNLSNGLSKLLRVVSYQNITVRHCGLAPLRFSPNAKLNKSILDRYLCLPMPDCKCMAEFIWIDGTGEQVRSKLRSLDYVPNDIKELPTWTHDGSNTYLSDGCYSDTFLCPVAMYNDPIRRGSNKMILCETYGFDHKPTRTNHRHWCVELLCKVQECEVEFGIEQEYQMMDLDGRPFGWPKELGEPAPAGPYYCGVGADKVYGREIVEAHYRACLYAGVDLFGANAEATLSQWEFQTGTTRGIKAADDLWMARFLLWRIAEDYGVAVSLFPKLFPHWNGSGAHVNMSTRQMRDDGGIVAIEEAIAKLAKKHKEHLKLYDPHGGEDNKLRLTGEFETSVLEVFTSDVANRNVSVRIPVQVAEAKKGYFEDRRPAANMDPYVVLGILVKTCLLD